MTNDSRGTVMSAIAAYAPQKLEEATLEDLIEKSLYSISVAATAIAVHHARRQGKKNLPDEPTLPHAANFLYQLTGSRPSPKEIEIIDKSFILLAEHGSNASTFTARVAASTGADFTASMTAALASLGGSLHGGGNGRGSGDARRNRLYSRCIWAVKTATETRKAH